jgi:hypothetical protein
VASVAFSLGRHFRPGVATAASLAAAERTTAAHFSSPLPTVAAEQNELANVTIENVAEVGFTQAYELLRGCEPDRLAVWASRLEAMPTGPRKTAAISTFYKMLVQLDTKLACDLALKTMQRDARATAIGAIVAAAPAANISEVAAMRLRLGGYDGSVSDLIERWSETDPVGVSRFIAAHPKSVDTYAIGTLLGNWAAIDPPAAKSWLSRLDASQRDSSVYQEFYSGWFERDTQAALHDLLENAGDEQVSEAIAVSATKLFRKSRDAAEAFILQLPSGSAQRGAVERIAQSAALHPEASAAPADVAAWLLALPREVCGDSIGSLVAAWTREEPSRVAAWMDQMPSSTRDWVAAKFCLAYQWDDPQPSFAAGLRISDPRLREETLRSALARAGAAQRARKLIRKLDLSTTEAAELNRIVGSL